MASGHASRINRPNTWLLRPDLRRKESPCQHGAVHTWHSFPVVPPGDNLGRNLEFPSRQRAKAVPLVLLDAIPAGRREPHACTRIRQALHDAGIEFVGHAKPGVRLCQYANYVSRPPSRARARHGVKRVSPRLAVLHGSKTVPVAATPRKPPRRPCGAKTRTGAPCQRRA